MPVKPRATAMMAPKSKRKSVVLTSQTVRNLRILSARHVFCLYHFVSPLYKPGEAMSKTKKIAAAVVMIGSMMSIQAMAQSATPSTMGDSSAMGSSATTPSKHMRHQQRAARNKAKRMTAPATTGAGRSTSGAAAGTPAAASGAGS